MRLTSLPDLALIRCGLAAKPIEDPGREILRGMTPAAPGMALARPNSPPEPRGKTARGPADAGRTRNGASAGVR